MPSVTPLTCRTIILLAVLLFSSGADPADAAETSPFHLGEVREAVFLSSGTVIALSGYYFNESVRAPEPGSLNRNDVPRIDRRAIDYHSRAAGYFSDGARNAAVVLPLVAMAGMHLSGDTTEWSALTTDLTMYAESVLLAGGLTLLAKGAFERPRPYAYNPDTPEGKLRDKDTARSFWSGHSALSFNGAVFAGYVFQRRRPDSPLVIPLWTLGLTTATVSAISRVRAGDHFPTDVIAGAAVGSFTGWFVPRMHRSDPKQVRVVPSGPGVEIEIRF